MRIRKRFPPSSPLSDPQLNRSPVVQQSTPQTTIQLQVVKIDSQPSDRPNQNMMRGSEIPRWFCSHAGNQNMVQQKQHQVNVEGLPEKLKTRNDPGKRNISSSLQDVESEEMIMAKDKGKEMMVTCEQKNKEERQSNLDVGNSKKSKRGSEIIEGSRCSRVNGRGWRCHQQTLVGYSLCEHHLGKGRLRSIRSVRNVTVAPHEPLMMDAGQEEKVVLDDDYEDGEKKTLVLKKKRMKLGVVKARSISSILRQNESAFTAVAGNYRSSC